MGKTELLEPIEALYWLHNHGFIRPTLKFLDDGKLYLECGYRMGHGEEHEADTPEELGFNIDQDQWWAQHGKTLSGASYWWIFD